MRIADAQWIPSTPHQTWDALQDPDVLQKCLPGCIKVERRTPTEYELVVRAKVAGLETDYQGEILLSDLDPPHSCTVAFEGRAGQRPGYRYRPGQPEPQGRRDAPELYGGGHGRRQAGRAGRIDHHEGRQQDRGEVLRRVHRPYGRPARLAPPPPPPEPEPRGLTNSRWSWAVALCVVLVILGYHTFFK